MFDLNIGGQLFVGFGVFAAVVTVVGIAMLLHYDKKEAG